MRQHESACLSFSPVRSGIMPARAPRFVAAALVCSLALFFLSMPQAAYAKVVDRIVATVNGEVITLFDLNAQLKPLLDRMKRQGVPPQNEESIAQLRKKVLDSQIENILIVQEAEKYKVSISDVEVDNYINRIKKSNQLDEDKFLDYLKAQNMTREEFAKKIRREMLRHRIVGYMVKRKVVITDEDIQQYYEEHKKDFMGQRTVDLALIVLPPGEDGTELAKQIRSGDVTFEEAASQHSIGPSAESGGTIGTLEWKSLAPAWKDALENLSTGDISDPFVLEGQQALLKVLGMTDGNARPVEEVHEEIADKIREPLLEERYGEYMEKLKEKAVIDIRL